MKVKLEKRIYDLSEKCFLKLTNKFFAHCLIKNGCTFFSLFKRYKFPSHELFEKYNANSLMIILVMCFILSGLTSIVL